MEPPTAVVNGGHHKVRIFASIKGRVAPGQDAETLDGFEETS